MMQLVPEYNVFLAIIVLRYIKTVTRIIMLTAMLKSKDTFMNGVTTFFLASKYVKLYALRNIITD